MRSRSNLQHLPTADSLLRHSDVRWGLNLVHGSVQSADLDFSVPSENGQKLTEIFTGMHVHGLHDGMLTAEDANQIRVWNEERVQLRERLAETTTELARFEHELTSENSANSGYREDRVREIHKAEGRRAEAKEAWDKLSNRLADLDRKIEVARRELLERERRQNATGYDDERTRVFRKQLIRLDWRIRKWRRVQQDVNNELVRQRETLVSGASDSKSKITIDLDNVRQSLFRLEQCAESLLDVVSRHSAAYKSVAPTADLNDELDGFKDQLDTVYTGLYRAHQSAAKEVSELTRERINWNLRALRRQRREISKCIKRLMKRRADLIHEIAPLCHNEHWLIEQAQNGFFLFASDDQSIDYSQAYEFKRPLDPAIAQLNELIAKLEGERSGLRDKRDTLRSEIAAIDQRLISLRKEAEKLGHDRIPQIQEQIRIAKDQITQLKSRLAKLDVLIDEREAKSREWIHHRLSEASGYLAAFSNGAYQHFSVELGKSGMLWIKNRYASELSYHNLPPVDRDLAGLALGISLLTDWARVGDHVVWNLAFDRLTTEQAVEVARTIAEHCPERLSLLITTAHEHLADRLHSHGFRVLDWETEELAEPTVELPKRKVETPKMIERAIILRSNNTDSEEFPGEFRDQVVRGSGSDSIFMKQENSREAYQSDEKANSDWETSEADLVTLENELDAIRRGSAYKDIVEFKPVRPSEIRHSEFRTSESDYRSIVQETWKSRTEAKRDSIDDPISDAVNRELDAEALTQWKERNNSEYYWKSVKEVQDEEPTIRAYRANTSIPPRTVPLDRVTKDSRLRDLGLFEIDEVEQLESNGIVLVRDMLTRDRTSIRRALGVEEVSHSKIEAWQRQLRLMCEVKKLSAFDARVLVACHVEDANALRQLEGYELAERIESLRKTKEGQQLLRSGSDEELTKLNAWVLNMKEAKALRQFGYHDAKDQANESRRRSSAGYRGSRSSRVDQATASSNGSKSHRLRKSDQDSRSTKSQSNETLKFYLNLDEQVEAAPSIGPKMAEHLEGVGIRTVRDLLSTSAEKIAKDLNHRRVNAETVQAWQRQTTLVCRVPNLRGHDAQLLVACEIYTPEQLAACNPEELFAIIQPFAESREGTKIIRSGKQPDLEEVQDWIRWAQSQRGLLVV